MTVCNCMHCTVSMDSTNFVPSTFWLTLTTPLRAARALHIRRVMYTLARSTRRDGQRRCYSAALTCQICWQSKVSCASSSVVTFLSVVCCFCTWCSTFLSCHASLYLPLCSLYTYGIQLVHWWTVHWSVLFGQYLCMTNHPPQCCWLGHQTCKTLSPKWPELFPVGR